METKNSTPLTAVAMIAISFVFGAFTVTSISGCVNSTARADDEKAVDGDPVTEPKAAEAKPGDWPQWGGSSIRNNVPEATNIPTDWNVGEFDRKTGAHIADDAENIKWVVRLGSQTYGNPVVSGGQLYVGTNNGGAYLSRYPADVDLGVMLCFSEETGEFLWQHSCEKLITGRVHDWPLQGICSSAYVEGDRVYFVTSRGEVVCDDTAGFRDGEDDGAPAGLGTVLEVTKTESNDQFGPAVAGLNDGKLADGLKTLLAERGVEITGDAKVAKSESGKGWTIEAKVDGKDRKLVAMIGGPKLIVKKQITVDDKHEADNIWTLDMMAPPYGVSQHNMASCSITAHGDILFVNTSNGLDESHINLPAPNAPSFIAVDKNTGKVLWTDRSPGSNILHGQWSSPSVADVGGELQVIFAGGDGWVYSFKADAGKDGKPTLLWKFDGNPKTSEWILGGRGTRNNIIATPVIWDDHVYIAVGQDPEHGEGVGHLWCLDPSKRGDISPQLVVSVDDRKKVIPPRRLKALNEEAGEVAIDNPNSGVVWHYSEEDTDGNGKVGFEETMHRSCGTVAIKDGVLFIADFSGLFHCIDAKTGKRNWVYDLLAQAWGSPLIVDGHVYIGDEDGEIAIFKMSADPEVAMEDGEPLNEVYMENSVYSTPIVANGVLYIANKSHLFAIKAGAKPE